MTKIPLYCMICGKTMEVDFTLCGYQPQGICSRKCYAELDWRKALSITNKSYYPDPNLGFTIHKLSESVNVVKE